MNSIKSIILFSLLFVSFNLSAETLLNKSSVSELVANVHKYAGIKDVDKVTSYLTDDASIVLEMPQNMGGTHNLNKDQYKKNLKEGFAATTNYTYDVKDIDVKISQDKRSATVTNTILETYEINGRIISSTAHEIFTIIISDRTLKINRVYGKIKPENLVVTTSM